MADCDDGFSTVGAVPTPTFGPNSRCNVISELHHNVWVEYRDEDKGIPGCCMLDTLDDSQVVGVLLHNPRSRTDLQRVTTDPHLLSLLANLRPLSDPQDEQDSIQKKIGKTSEAGAFYSVFQGKFPFPMP
jgi:hypothetical protein